jgi:hypothetical protein
MPEPPALLEDDVRAALAELVVRGPDPSSRRAAIDQRIAARHEELIRRRRVVAGVAATGAIGTLGVTWAVARARDDGPERTVTTGPPDTSTPPTSNAPGTSNAWQPISAAPLSARYGPDVVWAGDRLLVWSGLADFGQDPGVHADGAWWDRDRDTWNPISAEPGGVMRGGFAVWTGREMVVGPNEANAREPWNQGVAEADVQYGIAAYDPATDAWRYVAPIVADGDPRLGLGWQALVVGEQLLVAVRAAFPGAEGHENDVVLVDLASGGRLAVDAGPFARTPYTDASGDVTLALVGDLVVATPNWDLQPWVLDLTAGSWRQASAPPGADSLHLMPAVSAGDRALFDESDRQQLWLFDPQASGDAGWRSASANPHPHARWNYDPVWTGRELFVPGAAYDPDADSWRAVPAPPRGENRQREQMHGFWTGDALLLFGGEEYDCPDNATCDRSIGPDTLDGWIHADP